MSDAPVSAMVLAAGAGKRMRSRLPKPLHRLCGRPMLAYVLDSLSELKVDKTIVVVGHGGDQVAAQLHGQPEMGYGVDVVTQSRQLGTGDAVSVGLSAFGVAELDDESADILVLPADTPLLTAATVSGLVNRHREMAAAVTLLTARVEDPTGYGRVVRDRDGMVQAVVEHADATADELGIDEVNTSIYCFRRSLLSPALRRVGVDNAQGEYYLTDVVAVLREAGYTVGAVTAADADETRGVNDRVQLAEAEAELRRRTNESWQRRGVTMVDPASTYLDTTVELASDVVLYPNTLLQGRTVVEEAVELGPDVRLVDCVVGSGARLEHVTGRGAAIGAEAVVGPFVVLEPGSSIPAGEVTGSFYTAK